MRLPDLRELWSEDALVVERTCAEVIAVLERDPTLGIALLGAASGVGHDRDWPCQALERMMRLFEELAQKHEYVALLLMLCLSRPAGSSTGCYDVFDAIGLWMDGCNNPRIAQFLEDHVAFAESLSDRIKPTVRR